MNITGDILECPACAARACENCLISFGSSKRLRVDAPRLLTSEARAAVPGLQTSASRPPASKTVMVPYSCATCAVLLAAALACAAFGELSCGLDEVCGPQDVKTVDEASLLQSRGKLNQSSQTFEGEYDSETIESNKSNGNYVDCNGFKLHPEYTTDTIYCPNGVSDCISSNIEQAQHVCIYDMSDCRGFSIETSYSGADGATRVLYGRYRNGPPSWNNCCEYNRDYHTWLLKPVTGPFNC